MLNKRTEIQKTVISSILLLFLPLVSAFDGFDSGYYYLLQLLQNELVLFALIFLVFFALVYFTLNRTMKENKGAVFIISAVVALFAAFAISQKTSFYGFVGETIGNWIIIVIAAFAIILLIRFLISLGLFYFLVILGISWFFFSSINTYEFLPYELRGTVLSDLLLFLSSSIFLIALIAVTVILFIIAYAGAGNSTVKKLLWGPKKKSMLEKLTSSN